MRQAFLDAFNELGGVPALVRRGRRSPTEFYKLAARLIPTERPETERGRTLEEILESFYSAEEKAQWTRAAVRCGSPDLAITETQATRPATSEQPWP
jgi:hypothetical protein